MGARSAPLWGREREGRGKRKGKGVAEGDWGTDFGYLEDGSMTPSIGVIQPPGVLVRTVFPPFIQKNGNIRLRNKASPCCAQQTGMHIGCGSTAYSVVTVYGGKERLYTPGVCPALVATPCLASLAITLLIMSMTPSW